MFLFTIKASVNPRSKASAECHDCKDAGGAYVSCFISFKDSRAAKKLAKMLVREQGWIPESVMEPTKVQTHLMKSKRDKQYYSTAIKEGYCLVYATWPKDAPN